MLLKKYCDEYLDIALKLGISFFEQLEEYEKMCTSKTHFRQISEVFKINLDTQSFIIILNI